MKPALDRIPPGVHALADYARLAADHIDAATLAYIEGGSGDELSLDANQRAFDRLHLHNRVLADCTGGSTRLALLGEALDHPILLAPVAHHRLVHPDGEIATARGALDTLMVASTLSSVPLEEIARHAAGPRWFQLYFQPRREDTLRLVRRAEAAGYTAIMATLDAPLQTPGRRALLAGFRLGADLQPANLADQAPLPQVALPAGSSLIFQGMMREAPGWADLEWLLGQTRLPVLAKGVTHPADARRLIELGVAGIVVSNHGGRALDGMPSALDAIGPIRAIAGPAYPLLLDGGIRSGAHVFKALARGADAVMIGRPQLHALAVAGSLGVAHMLRLLREELEITMALAGCPTMRDITSDALFTQGTD